MHPSAWSTTGHQLLCVTRDIVPYKNTLKEIL